VGVLIILKRVEGLQIMVTIIRQVKEELVHLAALKTVSEPV
jgi:hypothetical protein